MKKRFVKCISLILLLAMVFTQTIDVQALAKANEKNYKSFENVLVSDDYLNQNMFWFGSKNMTISEKSSDNYLIKVCRGGNCENEASVTVKFTDISANYGENYTISAYDSLEKPKEEAGRTSVVDFMLNNADSQQETKSVSEEETVDKIVDYGEYDTLNADGKVISTTTVSEDRKNEESLSDDSSTEKLIEDENMNVGDDFNDVVNDKFPGTEIELCFDKGENEKYIVVTPKYSKKADGDCMVSVCLKNPSEGMCIPTDNFTTSIKITDEDNVKDAVISIEKSEYDAEGDSIFVTVNRSGAINEMVSVDFCTIAGTAEMGIDFQGYDATLYFPMGIISRTIKVPVNHTEKEKDLTFDVKLVNPVGCTTDVDEALITIKNRDEESSSESSYSDKNTSSSKEEKAILLSDENNDALVGKKINFEKISKVGNAWISNEKYRFSCKGVDYDTWNGGSYQFSNPYLYDGVRIKWNAWHDGWFSTSYTYINSDNQNKYKSEKNEWGSTTEDILFNQVKNKELWFGSLTSYFNGLQVSVDSIRPIFRSFKFNLKPAESLKFKGVSEAEAVEFTSAYFAGESDKTTFVQGSIGDSFTVSAPKTQNEYAKLARLNFYDKNGKKIFSINNSTNSRSITVNLNEDVLNSIACDSLEYLQDGKKYIGNITIQPVFEYIDSKVVIRSSEMGSFNGEYKTDSNEKTVACHLGDRLTLSTTVNSAFQGAYIADGVRFEQRDVDDKMIQNGSGTINYINNDSLNYTVNSQNIVLTPIFKENDNGVRVRILKDDVDGGIYDTESGLFKYNNGRIIDGDYYIYSASGTAVHLDRLISLNASLNDKNKVAIWSIPGKANNYSGNTFYFSAARDKEDNLITLSYGNSKKCNFSGKAFNTDKNLSTGNSVAAPIIPAAGALICAGIENTMADDTGDFKLENVQVCSNTLSRIMIYQNNTYTFKDVWVRDDNSSYELGVVTAASNTLDGSYFSNISCSQGEKAVTSSENLILNNKELKLTAEVKDGNKYVINGETKTENVTGVTFYVLDGTSHEIKTTINGSKNPDGSWSGVVQKFSPDSPEKFYYGDIIYVSMTTDRIQSDVKNELGEIPDSFKKTEYPMISTGYEIVKNLNSQPEKISMNLPIGADNTLEEQAGLNSEDSEKTKKSYASFPFIGAIDAVVAVGGYLKKASSIIDEDDGGGSAVQKTQYRVTISFKELPYGGTRIMFGMVARTGNTAWSASLGYNPLEAVRWSLDAKSTGEAGTKELISDNTRGTNIENLAKSSFGTPRMTFSIIIGFYVDFGIIQSTDTETGETTDFSDSDWEFLGIGGYFGGYFSVEMQWFTIIPVVNLPGYAGVGGSVGATAYIGGSKDPNKVLKYSDLYDEDNTMNIDKLNFNVEVVGDVSLKGYVGVGYPDVLGARIILGFNLSFAYSPYLKDYFTQVGDLWGLGAEVAVGGQIDLVFVSIPVSGFSIPIYSAGFTEYFVYLKRANKLADCVAKAIEEKGSNFSESYIAKAKELKDKLNSDIQNDEKLDVLVSDFEILLNYVYNDDIHLISASDRNSIYVITPYQVWLSEDKVENNYQLIQHTDSKWVANNNGTLMGTYEEEGTSALVENSYSQNSAKIIDIGEGNILSTFLMDTSDEGEVTNPELMYSIYDGKKWSEPVAVQGDGTIDYTPSVCDAGDKVLITWTSAGKDYKDYDNASEVFQDMDVFAATFDKSSKKISEKIVQLTDDEYMDSKPVAAYDSISGDIAVYYLKNNVSSDVVKAYATNNSRVCYRLYDGKTEKWIVEYFENEEKDANERERLANEYGGQRFLNSGIKGNNGNTLAITDITVCEGYNGIAAYAYTVDMDGDTSTNTDTELYLRLYDFENHKTYKPIRITDDNVSQGMPQLIRNNVPYTDYSKISSEEAQGDNVSGTTYLFWLENDNTVKYISATDLIRNGIEDNGAIKSDYNLSPVLINTKTRKGTESSVSSYQAITDNDDNLYIVWTQTESDEDVTAENITNPSALEIYAAAQIREKASGKYADTGGVVGGSWSAPYKLTDSGKCNDGVYGVISSADNKLYLMHNQYSVKFKGYEYDNPYEIGNTNLMFTTFQPMGSIEATEFSFSEDDPCAGEEITVTARIENTGLTTAKGYSLQFYESVNGKAGKRIYEEGFDEWLTANSNNEVSFTWKVPDNFDGMSIMCVARENNYEDVNVTCSDSFEAKAHYDIDIYSVKQNGDKFVVDYKVTNTGNKDAEDTDTLKISFTGLYGSYAAIYGLSERLLASVSMKGIEAKESKNFSTKFSVPITAFDYCGYDEIQMNVVDDNDKLLSETESELMELSAPMSVNMNSDKGNSLKVGEKAQISTNIDSQFLSRRSKIFYSAEDESIASVDKYGIVTAVGEGKTKIKAYVSPFGVTSETEITVSNDGRNSGSNGGSGKDVTVVEKKKFKDVDENSYYSKAVDWAVEKNITTGITEELFGPDYNCTRGQFVTLLWRTAGCSKVDGNSGFKDVMIGSYYYDAVKWAIEEGITTGTGNNCFSPDATISRAQAVTMLYRYSKSDYKSHNNSFIDVNGNDYYYSAVEWAVSKGITQGTEKDRFAPMMDCNRGQIVTFLHRYSNL